MHNKRTPLGKQIRRSKDSYLMIAPYFILFIIFTVLPVIMAIVVSFTDWNMLQMPNFVGWKNYVKLILDDDIFMISLKNTLIFAVITGPVSYMLCLLFAWIINEFNRNIFRRIIGILSQYPEPHTKNSITGIMNSPDFHPAMNIVFSYSLQKAFCFGIDRKNHLTVFSVRKHNIRIKIKNLVGDIIDHISKKAYQSIGRAICAFVRATAKLAHINIGNVDQNDLVFFVIALDDLIEKFDLAIIDR